MLRTSCKMQFLHLASCYLVGSNSMSVSVRGMERWSIDSDERMAQGGGGSGGGDAVDLSYQPLLFMWRLRPPFLGYYRRHEEIANHKPGRVADRLISERSEIYERFRLCLAHPSRLLPTFRSGLVCLIRLLLVFTSCGRQRNCPLIGPGPRVSDALSSIFNLNGSSLLK